MPTPSVPFAALLTLTWVLFSAPVHAQLASPSGLSLKAAIQTALQHSPELKAAQNDLQASEGAVTQAGAWLNPELQALVEDTRAETRTTTWQLSQPFEIGGKRAARVSAAQWAQAQAALALQARQAQVRADATEAFFALALAQERVRLAQASSQLGEQALQAASRRVQAGKVSPVEESRAKVAQASLSIELVQAQSERRVAQQRLSSLLGVPASQVLVLDWQGTASEPSAHAAFWARSPDWLSHAEAQLAESPALRQQQLEVERRHALSELEAARRIPDVTLTVGTKRAQELGRQQALLGVALSLPLWDRNEGQVLQALRLQDKAVADLAAAQRALSTQWIELKERYVSAQAEAQALERDILPGAQSAWQAAVTGFEAGKFSFLETLDAQRTLFQARAQHLRALGEMHRTAADIDRLLGTQEATP